MENIASNFIFILLLCISCFYSKFVSSTANLKPTKFLRDPQTLVSNNNLFKFGFFSPINSTNRYVGIWYNIGDSTTQEIVWIANRNNPIKNKSSGFLKISENGNLQLISDKNKTLIWSTNVTHQGNSSSSIVAKLLDSGNLVLESTLNQKIIWQSFEHLTDSLLSESRVTLNLTIDDGMRETPILRSWSSPSDPSMGRFRIGLIPFPITEFVVRDHDNIYWRSGPWNGTQFIGVPYGSAEVFSIVYHKHEFILDMLYYVPNNSFLDHYVLGYDGNVVLKSWNNVTKKWDIGWESIESKCDIFGQCGAFGLCNAQDSPICSCLNGFEPKNLDEWKKGNWSGGCVRRTSLKCGKTGSKSDGFLMLPHVKLPDDISFVKGEDGDGCRKECLEVCSCKAYAYVEGIGCMIWNDMIVDIQVFAADGVDLFLRLAHSELDEATNMKPIIAAIAATAATTFFVVLAYFLWNFMYRGHAHKKLKNEEAEDGEVDQPEFKDLSMFKFNDLEAATNNFSEMNKLGRGGFGLVYKGKLENGQEIAVKRLSRTSGQGLQEFMNEVLVISKLQHKNLVKLLGCCVVREEKLLVYEYMPNKSLDAFLFDLHHRIHLDWKKRFNIISGICRGLLYLHRDSRLKIIHRDLKASNILLDEEFNPKISDFGMARIFETKQDQANTLRVVGTYGYMSPEYAMEGRFSEKSDVFSLGVLMLEIVSGRKNGSNFLNYEALSLPTYAWKLWQENDVVSLIDPTIVDPCYKDEILKFIQLGLLCVQEYPRDRPTISTLVSMFEVDMNDLPQPTKPGFTQWNATSSDEHLQTGQEHGSINNVSLTAISGR